MLVRFPLGLARIFLPTLPRVSSLFQSKAIALLGLWARWGEYYEIIPKVCQRVQICFSGLLFTNKKGCFTCFKENGFEDFTSSQCARKLLSRFSCFNLTWMLTKFWLNQSIFIFQFFKDSKLLKEYWCLIKTKRTAEHEHSSTLKSCRKGIYASPFMSSTFSCTHFDTLLWMQRLR